MLHGKLEVESSKGHGSVFKIKFPSISIVEQSSDSNSSNNDDHKEYTFPVTRHVLIIDENKANRTLLKEILKECNFTCIEAENGKEALEKIHNRAIDLIIMDIRQPFENSVKALEYLREELPNKGIPVIACTTSYIQDQQTTTVGDVFHTILTKPIQIDEMYQLVASLFSNSSNAPQQILCPVNKQCSHCFDSQQQQEYDERCLIPFTNMKDVVILDEVKSIAAWMNDFSERAACPCLKKYASRIIEKADLFDIESIRTIINEILKDTRFNRE
jgi:CheY-like chemotaxis protein